MLVRRHSSSVGMQLRLGVLGAGTAAALAAAACSDSHGGATAPEPAAPLFKNQIAVVRTSNPQVPVVAVHKDGTRLAVLAGTGLEGVGGAVLTLPDGQQITVFMDDAGRPARAVLGDVVVAFGNYTETTVDLAVIGPDGAVNTARKVPLTPKPGVTTASGVLGGIRLSSAAAAQALASAGLLSSALKVASFGLSAVSCGVGVATVTSGVGAALAYGACTSAILTIAGAITGLDEPAVVSSAAGLAGVPALWASTGACAASLGKNVASCADVLGAGLGSAADAAAKKLDAKEAALRDAINPKPLPPTQPPGPPPGPPPVTNVIELQCDQEGRIRSAGATPATIRFVNLKFGLGNIPTDTAFIFWLDGEGKRVSYQVLPPGTEYLQPTYLGHRWLIAAEAFEGRTLPKRACHKIVESSTQSGVVVIDLGKSGGYM